MDRANVMKRHQVQYLQTPLFSSACALFGKKGIRARAFTILREPVSRIESLFFYKKYSTWEKDFDPTHKLKSMEEYITRAREVLTAYH